MGKKKVVKKKAENKGMLLGICVVLVAIVIIFGVIATGKSSNAQSDSDSSDISKLVVDENGNINIDVTNVSDKATFYNYDADGVTIELFAVKASDGTIRTAFNTCQVCSPSPLSYFVQQGKAFICQNCKNLFMTDKIGIEKGGCNPIPITEAERIDSGNTITITKEFVESYKENFDK